MSIHKAARGAEAWQQGWWNHQIAQAQGRIDYVPDEVFEQVRPHFTEEELANLTLVIATINAWNRFGVSFRDVSGNLNHRA